MSETQQNSVLRDSNGTATHAAPAPVSDELDNPFQADGELSRKADYIISHSRISRTEVQIADPDSPDPVDQLVEESTQMQLSDQPDAVTSTQPQKLQAPDLVVVSTTAVEAAQGGERPDVQEVKVSTCEQQAPSCAEKVKLRKKKACVIQ